MTIDKAIKISTIFTKSDKPILSTDLKDAIRLGIEAMKAHLKARTPPYPLIEAYLPGETEEEPMKSTNHHERGEQAH